MAQQHRANNAVIAPHAPRAARRSWPNSVVFEIAWEVCNQVGGIYQVLRSKAPIMVDRWENRYCMVGPYFAERSHLEFESVGAVGFLRQVIHRAAEQGLNVHYGRWIITGRPRVVLLEHGRLHSRLPELKRVLREQHGIETESHDPLVEEVILFAEATRIFLECAMDEWRTGPKNRKRVLAHFHEWLGGLALPMLSQEPDRRIATTFTTHATQLGRVVASNEEMFYERLSTLDPDAAAMQYGVRAQHEIERACANSCDLFTTVSPITAEECTSLLGRTPDFVTPNGLNIDRFDEGADFQTIHGQYKEYIHRFVMGHFFPSYAFDLDKTLYFFTAGRYEPRNKGFDLCLETMARLNLELSAANLDVNVVFFIVTERPIRSLDPHALHARGVLDELREVSRHISEQVSERLFRHGAAGERMALDELVDEYWRLRFRRTQHAFKSDWLPPVATHFLSDPDGDPVMQQIRSLGLCNSKHQPVKVVYHPQFISSVNPLWRIEYEQFVRGCHLGIFPSSYEPWGYTPLECLAMGVPSITSDLAGFGRYVGETYPDHDDWGVNLLARRGRDFHTSAAELTAKLMAFCKLDRKGRIALRNELPPRAWEFDWSSLGEAYHDVHDHALAALKL